MIITQSAGYSDIGKVRKANEDSYLLNPSVGLYVVADGMGGHRGGDVASQMAVDIIQHYLSVPSNPLGSTDDGKDDTLDNEHANRLIESISLANQRIYERSVAEEAFKGMGTTVSALYFNEDTMIAANVGDSPIYLIRNQEIERLYTPHTLLHERHRIPKAVLNRFPEERLGHILTRAVGIRDSVNVDILETPCFENDIVVLCSDGLSNNIQKEEILSLTDPNDLDGTCEKMTALANQRGGEDNITIILIHVVSTKPGFKEMLLSRILAVPLKVASLFGVRKRS